MTPPSYLEATISQVPALQLLQKLGYTYLSPADVAVERRGRLRYVILETILTAQLQRLNRFQAGGSEHAFSDENIARAVQRLREPEANGLVPTSAAIYDLLTLGVSFEEEAAGKTRNPQLRYIDWEHPHNNVFHVTAEFEVERSGSSGLRRPDIVCFVNGIPFIVIECKRPDEKDALVAGIKQTLRNQEANQIPLLYATCQLALAIHPNAGAYGTTGTPEKFWARWREGHETDEALTRLVNATPTRADHDKLFAGMFAAEREAAERKAAGPVTPTAQDMFLHALCRPERLLELARQFILFDEGGSVKKIARYQQYFAVKRTLERVRQRTPEGRRKGGVIWHTQGSGKSLTMVWLGIALALDTGIKNPRVVIVTDRINLDEQIWGTFARCGKEPVQAKSGKHLLTLLQNDKAAVITTVIDKFAAASKADGVVVDDENLFVLVDESHRSQYGEANTRMLKTLPRACFIGFTGTPLMKREKNTARQFGGFIDPAYTIRDAVADGAVVPLLYEGRHVMQAVNRSAVDRMFETLSEGLTQEQKADLKRKFSARDELNKLESRLYLIAWDVSRDFERMWKGTGFKAQLAAPGKKAAIRLKQLLDEFGKVSSEVVISPPDDREGEGDDATADESVVRFWRRMMERYGNETAYNKAVTDAFQRDGDPDILIVVDKLLTGFDAPRNRVLYIAKNLREHNLLQAIARVNRLHDGKDEGLIIDYYGVAGELHEAMELYTALGETFDREDLDGTLTDVSEELRKLPDQRSAVWAFFAGVENRNDTEACELALEDADTRDEFYTALSRFSRTLKLALSSLLWMKQTPEDEIDAIKADAKFFHRLRASVKLRYAEEVDYRQYEAQIQKMLNTYVQADEVVQVVAPVNIFEREAFEAEIDKLRSPRAKADTILNRTKKTITERMDEDPIFYRRLSMLIEQTIEDYRAQRIGEAELLERALAIMEEAREGRAGNAPTALRERDLARALYGSLKETLWETITHPPAETSRTPFLAAEKPKRPYGTKPAAPEAAAEGLLVEVACAVENIIRTHSVVGWRENIDAQNRMRNEIDDLLYGLESAHGITLSESQMNTILDAALEIATHRTQDV